MPIPRISIRALRAFIAVYEEQSFSKAAARENATQSGMSTQVKNLELKLGAPLLMRDRKEYTLTPAGQLVYRDGQAILKALMATEAAVSEMQSEVAGLVRVGLIPSLTRSVLIPALDAFKAEFDRVELSMLEEYSGSLMRRVLDGELDFAVVPSGDIPSGLTARFVARDREMIMGRPGALPEWPHLGPAPLSALTGAKLIVPSRANVRRKRIDGLLAAHGVHVAELMEMDGMLGTIELVGQTDWLAILPSALCYADKDGRVRKLNVLNDPPMTFDYVIVEKTETPLPHAAALLAQHLTRHTKLILDDWADLGVPAIA
jgi:LysR family transcriptional regulator, nitrogen assimilation regulatory protein